MSASSLVAPQSVSRKPNLRVPTIFSSTIFQILPQNVERQELVTTMRRFEQGLGVECEYCHAPLPAGACDAEGRGNHDLDKPLDFPSDAKTEKASARTMMRMVATINHDYVSKVEQAHTTVTCWTCHRGNTQPDIAPSLPDEPEEH